MKDPPRRAGEASRFGDRFANEREAPLIVDGHRAGRANPREPAPRRSRAPSADESIKIVPNAMTGTPTRPAAA